MNDTRLKLLIIIGGFTAVVLAGRAFHDPSAVTPEPAPLVETEAPTAKPPVAAFAERGLTWLAEAQHKSGGWGGGSHAAQNVRDPHAVVADPGTTAFAAMAFLRAGHTPVAGRFKETVARSLQYMLSVVESAPAEGPQISDVTGTQPQAKLGRNVDTALACQFLSRVLPEVKGDAALAARVTKAIAKCVTKIEKSQNQAGNWSEGGWAPVLQSSLMNTSLEMALANECPVDAGVLVKSRDYQKTQVNAANGSIATGEAAGVQLYALSSNVRATAAEAEVAECLIEDAKRSGKVAADSRVSEETLRAAGSTAAQAQTLALAWGQNEFSKQQMGKDEVLDGFGSNGGEEFLSYLQKSEALLIGRSEAFEKWNERMAGRFEKIQNADGSWSGHHCIASPVFCTAAVVLTVAAERDADLLRKGALVAAK